MKTLAAIASRKLTLVVLTLLLLAGSARATWSIIAVNTRTREICVSSATCLANFDLQRWLPVVVVGKGAGCAQSFVDNSGLNRLAIFNGLNAYMPPANILQVLQQIDPGFQTRQYGIVDVFNTPVTFTGTGAGIAKFGVTGSDGEIRYAIQGNVLTGNQVVTAAEAAFLNLQGDLSSKVLAAMEAARALGGDGRCSCNPGAPTSCGVPPPNFTKSAHIGFFIDARLGDTDGVCNTSLGCASGSYTVSLNVIGSTTSPDPVYTLTSQYYAWRAAQAGHADGIKSVVQAAADSLPADGLSETTVDVTLFDIEGVPITQGGATLTLSNTSGVAAVTTPGPITDNGNGSYTFSLRAGALAGEDHWAIKVDDGTHVATMAPYLKLRVDPNFDLHCGFDAVSAARGVLVPFTFNLGAASAGRTYLLLASASGTQPGTVFMGTRVPLNFDKFFRLAARKANTAILPNSSAALDASGRALAGFQTRGVDMAALIGGRLDFSAIIFYGHNPVPTSGAGFDILP
jgi:hypothetical protein